MAIDEIDNNKKHSDGQDAAKADIDELDHKPDSEKQRTKNIPTMVEPVSDAPPDIDLDLLDVPILTDKVSNENRTAEDEANGQTESKQKTQNQENQNQD